MAVLEWDKLEDRRFEAGVDRGVFYDKEGRGFAWNGLISVDDGAVDQVEPVFFDGEKVNDVFTPGDYTGVVRAYTYPDELLPYVGTLELDQGMFLTQQPHQRFGLSYRTKIGNAVDGFEAGYKLHIIYNVTALHQDISYETLNTDPEAIEFEWAISAIPEDVDFFRPTAHVIFDSTKMHSGLFADIEAILYGDDDNEPRLPSLKSLASYIKKWNRLIITDNGDGTWTAEANGADIIYMWFNDQFIIIAPEGSAEYINPDTYEIQSSGEIEVEP